MNKRSETFTIDLRRLGVLRTLQERGTVVATVGALNLTPSAVSQQIAALSREAGVPLLIAQGRGVRLTPQAMLLLDHAAAMDAQWQRVRADLAAFDQGTVGRVRIGAFATAITGIVVPALIQLRRERPRLRLSILESEAPDCFTRLDAGDLDLVITVDHRDGPVSGDPRYHRRELQDDPLLAALAEDHPLAGRTALDLQDLAKGPWIVGAMRGPCQELGLAACAAAGFSPDIVHHANDWSAVFALVAADCGVALVPRLAVPAPPPPGVVLRALDGPRSPCRHVYAAVRAGAENHPGLLPVLAALGGISMGRSAGPKKAGTAS
ncbi:MAG: LysR family transcriptional regulator [Holophaga sp.]|nr:LysR family transcriptional regulator [Holophaga sp.]